MIYLDNAATTWPKPEAVYQAMDRFARTNAANPGRSGHRMAAEAERVIAETRSAVAKLLGASSPTAIVFTLNATDALNIAIKGVLRRGDHVITTHLEHNSINRPLRRLEEEEFITVSRASAGDGGIVPEEEIENLITQKTRLVAVTHCSNVIGQVNPIAYYGKVARKHNILLLLDASQSAGVVEIDVVQAHVDMLACPGHKGLFGPMGTGILYVKPGLEVSPFREGATGTQSEVERHPLDMPHRLEGGTPNAHGLAGLGAGVRFLLEEGVQKIRRHESDLALRFSDRLRDNSKVIIYSAKNREQQIGPVAINLRGSEPLEIASLLDQRFAIACRAGLHCAPGAHRFLRTFPSGAIRFSFGYFNTVEHVDAAVQAVNDISTGY